MSTESADNSSNRQLSPANTSPSTIRMASENTMQQNPSVKPRSMVDQENLAPPSIETVPEELQTELSGVFDKTLSFEEQFERARAFAKAHNISEVTIMALLHKFIVETQQRRQTAPEKTLTPTFCSLPLPKLSLFLAKEFPGPVTASNYNAFRSNLTILLNQFPEGRALLDDSSTATTVGASHVLSRLASLFPQYILVPELDYLSVPVALQRLDNTFEREIDELHATAFNQLWFINRKPPASPLQTPTLKNLYKYVDYALNRWARIMQFTKERTVREEALINSHRDLLLSLDYTRWSYMEERIKGETLTFFQFLHILREMAPRQFDDDYIPFPTDEDSPSVHNAGTGRTAWTPCPDCNDRHAFEYICLQRVGMKTDEVVARHKKAANFKPRRANRSRK